MRINGCLVAGAFTMLLHMPATAQNRGVVVRLLEHPTGVTAMMAGTMGNLMIGKGDLTVVVRTTEPSGRRREARYRNRDNVLSRSGEHEAMNPPEFRIPQFEDVDRVWITIAGSNRTYGCRDNTAALRRVAILSGELPPEGRFFLCNW